MHTFQIQSRRLKAALLSVVIPVTAGNLSQEADRLRQTPSWAGSSPWATLFTTADSKNRIQSI